MPDGRSDELAPRWFEKNPGREVNFRVGRSSAATDWSAHHPPDRTFTIRFAAPPPGDYVLRCHLELSAPDGGFHGNPVPPRYRVAINGHRGTFRVAPQAARPWNDYDGMFSPAYAVATVEARLPAAWLRAGENTIALTVLEGSGVWYDAVVLERQAGGAAAPPAALEPTVFYRRRDGKLYEEVWVRLRHDQPLSGEVTVEIAGQAFRFPVTESEEFGDWEQRFEVAETAASTAGITAGGQAFQVPFRPRRKWKLYAAPSIHNDIGYTDRQEKTTEEKNQATDALLGLLARAPWYRYNLESSWLVERYLAAREPAQQARLTEALREGRMGVQAFYANLLTGLADLELLARSLYYAAGLNQRYDVALDFATVTDVPTLSWSVPSVLAAAGVRYLALGPNTIRAPVLIMNPLDRRSPYWWEGPDGRRVLVWHGRHYYHMAQLLGNPASPETARSNLQRYLEQFDREDYAPDALLLYGLFQDNAPPADGHSAFLLEWQQEYAYPEIVTVRFADYFADVEKRFGDKLPVLKGHLGAYWEDGAASTARETALVRQNLAAAAAAEQISTAAWLLGAVAYPADELDRMWKDMLLYIEHTWGAANSAAEPESEQTESQWAYKRAFARRAHDAAQAVMDRAMTSLGAAVKHPASSVLVYNPSSWDRGGPLHIELPSGSRLLDPETMKPLPQVNLGSSGNAVRALVWLPAVPANGYRLFSRAAGKTQGLGVGGQGPVENRFYRLTLNPLTGAVASLIDKETGRELVDRSAPYGLNQLLYVTGGGSNSGEGFGYRDVARRETSRYSRLVFYNQAYPPAKLTEHVPAGAAAEILKTELGVLVRIKSSAFRFPRLETDILLYDGSKRIDFINRVIKEETFETEALYFAFPFAGAKTPEICFDLAQGFTCPAADLLPGGAAEWHALNRWLSVREGDFTVGWASPAAPLVALGDIVRGRWPEKFRATNGWVFSYAMNNYWFTNYRAGQGGEHVFRYSLTSGRLDGAALARFGDEVAAPLPAAQLATASGGTLLPASGKFVELDSTTAVVTTIKRAENGMHVVVRLRETAGKASEVTLRFPLWTVVSAWLSDLVERPAERLRFAEGGSLRLRLTEHGTATVVVNVNRRPETGGRRPQEKRN